MYHISKHYGYFESVCECVCVFWSWSEGPEGRTWAIPAIIPRGDLVRRHTLAPVGYPTHQHAQTAESLCSVPKSRERLLLLLLLRGLASAGGAAADSLESKHGVCPFWQGSMGPGQEQQDFRRSLSFSPVGRLSLRLRHTAHTLACPKKIPGMWLVCLAVTWCVAWPMANRAAEGRMCPRLLFLFLLPSATFRDTIHPGHDARSSSRGPLAADSAGRRHGQVSASPPLLAQFGSHAALPQDKRLKKNGRLPERQGLFHVTTMGLRAVESRSVLVRHRQEIRACCAI